MPKVSKESASTVQQLCALSTPIARRSTRRATRSTPHRDTAPSARSFPPAAEQRRVQARYLVSIRGGSLGGDGELTPFAGKASTTAAPYGVPSRDDTEVLGAAPGTRLRRAGGTGGARGAPPERSLDRLAARATKLTVIDWDTQ